MDRNPLRLCQIADRAQRPASEDASKTDWGRFLATLGLGAVALALRGKQGGGSSPPVKTITMSAAPTSDSPANWPLIALGGVGATLAVAGLQSFLRDMILRLETSIPTTAQASTPASVTTAMSVSSQPRLSIEPLPLVIPPLGIAPHPAIASTSSELALPAENPPPDTIWLSLAPFPSIILVIGERGSGKTGLGYRIVELNRHRATPYVVGLPPNAQKLLPDWMGMADALEDVPRGAIVLLDEAYTRYHARGSMTAAGRSISDLVNLSRQKRQSLIFIGQEGAQLDRNIVSQVDVIAIKELSEISMEFERREFRRFTDKARAAFSTIRGNRQAWTWVHSEKADYEGLVENQLPEFWSPALSRSFADAVVSQDGKHRSIPRKGSKTSKEDLVAQARDLVEVREYTYGEASQIMGLPKSTVWDLLNRDPRPEN